MKNVIEHAQTKGAIKIESIVPVRTLAKARLIEQKFRDLQFPKGADRKDRSADMLEKDQEAIQLLRDLQTKDDDALVFGFMLYNEPSITKCYWAKRVGKKRMNKSEWFDPDKYMDWLTNIYAMLSGRTKEFKDPLYYYRPGGVDNKGNPCGDYDVINSFTTYWNMYFLPNLAIYMHKRDEREENADRGAISIDAVLETENGAGNRLEGELAANANAIDNPEVFQDYLAVEEMLSAFTKGELAKAIPCKADSLSKGLTYRDVMLALVRGIGDGSLGSSTGLRRVLNLNIAAQTRIMNHIQEVFQEYGVNLQLLADYLTHFAQIAVNILRGKVDSCSHYGA